MNKAAFIDTSVIVNSFLVEETDSKYSQRVMKLVASGDIDAAISELTLIETGAAITRRTGNVEKSKKFVEELRKYPNLFIIPITSTVVKKALEIALENGLRACDAIQVATAISDEIGLFIQRDRDFERCKDIVDIVTPQVLVEKMKEVMG